MEIPEPGKSTFPMSFWQNYKKSSRYIRLTQWEYWPSKLFYWPMYFYIPWYQFRARNLVFFTAANPGIDTGGIGLESKFEAMQLYPKEMCPRSILFKKDDKVQDLNRRLSEQNISYPLIAKPDLGYRGLLVKKIHTPTQLESFLRQYKLDFIIQELIEGMEEFGVFYIRHPEQEKGNITSLTLKEFLSVTGDNRSTVEELVKQKSRAMLQLEALQKSQPQLLKKVPAKGEHIALGVIGNHSKGTMFINGKHLIDDELITTFDKISKRIDGFYYGRFDIKCPSFEDLKKGKNIKIIELNGTCSEPTHIYDASKISYFGALREIIWCWRTIFQISQANHKRGIAYQSQREIAKRFINLRKYFIEIKKMASN